MNSHRIAYSLLVLLAVGLGGCASQPRRELAHLPGTTGCFWTRNIFDWTVLDASTVLVHSPGPRDAYLIKLFAPIPDLRFHEVLGFEGGDGHPDQFCTDNGYVIVRGPVPQREPVVAVRVLSPLEARQLLAGAGHPAPHRPPARGSAPGS